MLDFTDVIAYWYCKNHVAFTWSLLLAKFPHFVLVDDLGGLRYFLSSEITQLLFSAAILHCIANVCIYAEKFLVSLQELLLLVVDL